MSKELTDSIKDRVHGCGMSNSGSTYLKVSEVAGVKVEPPVAVVIDKEKVDPLIDVVNDQKIDQQVSLTQGVNTVRYSTDELKRIGKGDAITGLNRVLGDIAVNGPLEMDAIKPLHPDIIDGNAAVVAPAALPDIAGHAVVIR